MFSRLCRNALTPSRWLGRPKSTSASTAVSRTSAQADAERLWASTVVHGRGVAEPYYHPKTHGIPVALIHFRSHYPHLVDQFVHFTSHAAAALAIPISKPVHLPTQRSLWTVPKGPFAHKKSQENFERRVHKRAIKAWDADQEVVERWVKYLEEHALAGVGIRVVRWQRAPVGIGQKALESVVNQLRLGSETRSEKVKALGEQIIKQETAASGASTKNPS